MTGVSLHHRHILVVEDDFLLPSKPRRALEEAGATVVGPVGTVPGALDLITSAPVADGAILDVNLRDQMVFPAADMLVRRGVPFLFTTGYDQTVLPPRFDNFPRLEKPITPAGAIRAMAEPIDHRQ
ncbi:response regulator [Paracoccus benzoatiresistens]|uniref:Response regulator n=1 Tax=Paracoccus benzoatiresistens TaxID=2997341 RepID=A0ABT4J7S2_9RHOB|nr:response regulator [Paracoccus sp. EF6]MCZ0963165.1 response regulator [Paracoccus sp. EF6]